MNKIFGKFQSDICGLLWLSSAIFMGLSLYSYQPRDPSFNTIGRGLIVNNYCGYFGSFISDLAFQGLGVASWGIILLSLRFSWKAFLKLPNVEGHKFKWIWTLCLLVTACSLAALYWPDIRLYSSRIPIGGIMGLMVTKGLLKTFNFWGEVLVLWTFAIIMLVFFFERSLKELIFLPVKVLIWPFRSLSKEGILSLRFEFWKKLVGFFPLHPFQYKQKQQSKRRIKLLSLLKLKVVSQDFRFKYVSRKKTMTGTDNLSALRTQAESSGDILGLQRGALSRSKNFPVQSLKAGSLFGKKTTKLKRPQNVANWQMPSLNLLEDPPLPKNSIDARFIQERGELLLNKFRQFSVGGEIVKIITGPAVTLFEFKPEVNVRINKITELADDLSLALSSESIRVIAPIPGRDVVGIEVSNKTREMVYLKNVLMEEKFWEDGMKLPLALGANTQGSYNVVNLRKIPHLMIAGSTGSGKSVFVVSLITGLIMRHSPKTLRLILVDPKQVDLAGFDRIPHLLMPPVRENKRAILVLKWCVREMEKRYRSMAKFGTRGIEDFNKKVATLKAEEVHDHREKNESLEGAGIFDSYYYSAQPFIVLIIEEFGDLMAVDKGQVETLIVRLSQMARACGIHLILAMQSPRKDVVTGLIKTNVPGRISFKVASKMDSRIILDESGAERLLASGDMLFLAPGVARPERHHGPWISDEEIKVVTDFWRDQGELVFDEQLLQTMESMNGKSSSGNGSLEDEYDEKYDEVLAYTSTLKEVSASLIQRRFRLGYPRAARIIECFESEGVVGPSNGSKPRQVLCKSLDNL